ncbi:MAG: endolytic transglycosylase MltG [Clostridia bacterium]|nr:endolytic transglycosylase MltG [Clostridia bacterium]
MSNKNVDNKSDTFEFDTTPFFESLDNAMDKNEQPERSNKKPAKKTWRKTLIWALSLLLVIFVISYAGLIFAFDFLGLGESKDVDVSIPKGATTFQIARQLEDEGVIRSALYFRLFSKLKGYDSDFKYGVYVFSQDMSYETIARKLTTEGEVAEAVKVVIPEGATIDEIAKKLEEYGVCTAKEFRKALRHEDYNYDFIKDIPEDVYYRLEGYLYPDTYEFYNYGGEECAHRAIDKMLANFEEKFDYNLQKAAADRGYTIHDITTMASIIEMEASSAPYEEKQRVSAVFFNRLAWTSEPNLLGSSPTAEYPYGNGKYNTNKYTGLPPGPMCSPSIDSIKATVEPMQNFDACYFVTDKENKFYYNNSYEAHKSTIADLKSKGLWA